MHLADITRKYDFGDCAPRYASEREKKRLIKIRSCLSFILCLSPHNFGRFGGPERSTKGPLAAEVYRGWLGRGLPLEMSFTYVCKGPPTKRCCCSQVRSHTHTHTQMDGWMCCLARLSGHFTSIQQIGDSLYRIAHKETLLAVI